MFYAFVILGMLTLVGSLSGLLIGAPRGRSFAPLHIISLVLLAVAWWATHMTTTGRLCLIVAAAVELAARLLSRRSPTRGDALAEDPAVDSGDIPGFRTIGEIASHSSPNSPVLADDKPDRFSANFKPTAKAQPDEDAMLAASWTPEMGEIAAARAKAGAAGPTPNPGAPTTRPQPPDESTEADATDFRSDIRAVDQGVDMSAQHGAQTSGMYATHEAGTDAAPSSAPIEENLPKLCIKSEVFFTRECGISPSVFVASLRRGGRRDATADELDPSAEPRVRVGPVALDYRLEQSPRDSLLIEETLTHFEHPAEFAERVRHHAAHVTLSARHDIDTPRDQVVRILHHAHAALAEFAPVAAAFWPDARMLTPTEQLAGLLDYARSPGQSMWRSCTHIRGFALSGENEGMLLFDSVGLLAFGLPDVQVIAPSAHEAAARKTIDLITERIFTSGCDMPHGTEYAASDGLTWRVNYTRSAFVPDREVVQLALKTA